jgi:c(7)-type cytochrome triheme protein
MVFAMASMALAVPPGKEIVFDKGAMGKVTFKGKVHADAGAKCPDCHKPDLFPKMKKGTVEIKMKDIYEGKLCGACHDGKEHLGKVVFEAKSNCKKCHVK